MLFCDEGVAPNFVMFQNESSAVFFLFSPVPIALEQTLHFALTIAAFLAISWALPRAWKSLRSLKCRKLVRKT